MPASWLMIALGDSYSAGTGASPGESWPARFVDIVTAAGGGPGRLVNLSSNGHTSADVWRLQAPELEGLPIPDLLTLMVGANDIVRRVPLSAYIDTCSDLLAAMSARQPDQRRIWLITSPDFGETPAGRAYGDPRQVAAATAAENTGLAGLASRRGHPLFELTPQFISALARPGGLADDELHYSAATYVAWAQALWSEAGRRGLDALWPLTERV